MFNKILIANRGEIACRIIKTARAMGIKTVAVYSDADATALHVEMADEAVHLGPSPAAQSYLLGEKIIEACKATGAEAVHPGYGFLSERAWFAKALDDAHITFIGPPANAIAAMGDKIESKKLAIKAGVSVVPGYVGEIADDIEAVKIAKDIGYPVMIKASAGGGGKGMRVAYTETEVREGFKGARHEAIASFGDDRIFIEKFVEEPRHIEIQLIGDKHDNIMYLGERECSIQRRHQKVIEEAPSPFVTPDMRRAMGEQAVQLAKAVGYYSAGTVEFIAGKNREFYFLEMNTRLQVEHPVTELVTGYDLVELMIRAAAGEKFSFTQSDIKLNGWAMESRIYAEDPYRGFLPSIGRLVRYQQPKEFSSANETVRVDSGVVEGSEISMFYDPMIAKLVSHATSRHAAIDLQIKALDEYHIQGISHNGHFVSAVMQHEKFRSGTFTTAFIAEEYPDGFHGNPTSSESKQKLMAAAAVMKVLTIRRESLIDGQLNGHDAIFDDNWVVTLDKMQTSVKVMELSNEFTVKAEAWQHKIITGWKVGSPQFKALIDNEALTVEVDYKSVDVKLSFRGASHTISVQTPFAALLAGYMVEKIKPDMSNYLLCPMPGLVVSIDVTVGEKVETGQTLAVVEAMKMENILRAQKPATVKEILVDKGQSLALDSIILTFE